MVFYLVVNLVCLICSVAVVALVALVILAWAVIENLREMGDCHSDYDKYYSKMCICTNQQGQTITLRKCLL